jgi:hypothetical protein
MLLGNLDTAARDGGVQNYSGSCKGLCDMLRRSLQRDKGRREGEE